MKVTIGHRQIERDDARRISEGLRRRAAGFGEPLAHDDAALAAAEAIERACSGDENPVMLIGEQPALEALQEVLIAITKSSVGADPELQGFLTDVTSALFALY